MSKQPDEPGGWKYALAAAGAAPRCGARRKANGLACRAPAMANGRCHKHGGASTGPRTVEGRERCRVAPWKHGGRAAEARNAARERGEVQRLITALRGYDDPAGQGGLG
jgi:hypothetical protein